MASHEMTEDEKKAVHGTFSELVNIPPAKLRKWLDSEESRSVGMTLCG
jgi:hypothetical protein